MSQTDQERLTEVRANIVMITLLETRQWLESRHPFLGQPQSVSTEAPVATTRNFVPALSN